MGQLLVQEDKKPGVQHTQLVPGMGAWGGGHCAQEVRGPPASPGTLGAQAALDLGLGRGFWGLSLVSAQCQSNSSLPGGGAQPAVPVPARGGQQEAISSYPWAKADCAASSGHCGCAPSPGLGVGLGGRAHWH